jgi:hypothetical protein
MFAGMLTSHVAFTQHMCCRYHNAVYLSTISLSKLQKLGQTTLGRSRQVGAVFGKEVESVEANH